MQRRLSLSGRSGEYLTDSPSYESSLHLQIEAVDDGDIQVAANMAARFRELLPQDGGEGTLGNLTKAGIIAVVAHSGGILHPLHVVWISRSTRRQHGTTRCADAQHFQIKARWGGSTENGACPACKIVWNSKSTKVTVHSICITTVWNSLRPTLLFWRRHSRAWFCTFWMTK
jgi:hypothetical protein